MAKLKKALEKNATAKTEAKATTTAPAGQWFKKGSEGLERKHQLDKQAAVRKEKGVPRFYLKNTPGNRDDGQKDNEGRIVFLDSEGVYIYEHNLKLEGRWGNHLTCIKDYQPCPVCSQLSDKPTYVCYYTVIDTRKYVKKDGTISKFRKVLFPAKGAAMDIIADICKKNKEDLRGLVVDVKRMGERDPNCGRDFSVAGRVDVVKKFGEEMAAPYDYTKVLAPPTPFELQAAGIKTPTIAGSDEDMEEMDSADAGSMDEDTKALLGDE